MHYLQRVAGEKVMEELWFNLLNGPRRALCALAHIDAPLEQLSWQRISVAHRVSLVRAMHAMAEISVDCAVAMQLARDALERSDAHH